MPWQLPGATSDGRPAVKQRLLLHIGGQKTGTTTLQVFLTKNAALLMARHRILYPTSGPLFLDIGHFPCVSAFIAPENCEFVPPRHRLSADQVVDSLHRVARDRPELIVLSAEHFSSRLKRPDILRLADALSAFDTTILYYARRQDDLAVSSFSTSLCAGTRGWFDPRRVSPDSRYYNHLSLADDWAAGFGAARIRVRAFDSLARGIEGDFIEVIDAEPAGLAPVPRRKRKLSLEEATLLHRLNQHLTSWTDVAGTAEVDRFYTAQRSRERIVDKIAHEIDKKTSLNAILTPAERGAIMAGFADSNRQLAERYGAEIPRRVEDVAAAASETPVDETEPLARLLIRTTDRLIELEQQVEKLSARTLRGRLHAARSAAARCVHAVWPELPPVGATLRRAATSLQPRPRRPISRNLVRR
jgi:hypothetical protein